MKIRAETKKLNIPQNSKVTTPLQSELQEPLCLCSNGARLPTSARTAMMMATAGRPNSFPAGGGASQRQEAQFTHEMLADIWLLVNCSDFFKKKNIVP